LLWHLPLLLRFFIFIPMCWWQLHTPATCFPYIPREPITTQTVLYTKCFHLYQQSSWTACPLKIGPTDCPETSVTNYQTTPHNIPERECLNYTTAEAWNLTCYSTSLLSCQAECSFLSPTLPSLDNTILVTSLHLCLLWCLCLLVHLPAIILPIMF
jgi:hypothetical protein